MDTAENGQSISCDEDEESLDPKIGMDLGFPRVSSSGHCEITEKRDDVCQESACGSLSPSADEQCLDDRMQERDDQSEKGLHGANSRKMKPKREDRKCTVCGDKALGYNFDAITCESCKAFFRRNANKAKHPRCMFQGKCVIDPNTRRFCSACRLEKCFTVGMKKEMILGDDERQKRIEKVKQNRAKKLVQLQKQTGVDFMVTSNDNQQLCVAPVTPNTMMNKLCDIKIERGEDVSPSGLDSATYWSTQNGSSSVSSSLSPTMNADSDTATHRLLNERERNFIEFLDKSYFSTFGSTAEEPPMVMEMSSLEDLMNHIGLLVKLLIKFAKKLPDFIALPQAAQVTLLKGSLLDCITWRSAQLYNVEKGKWINQDGQEIPTQLLNAAFDSVDDKIKQEHILLITQLKELIGQDTTLVAMIQTAALFTPEYSSPGARAQTSSIQDKYLCLLKHYLEANHSWADAFEIFSKVLLLQHRVKIYSAKHSKAFLNCDASQVEPLLLEVFDIASHRTVPY